MVALRQQLQRIQDETEEIYWNEDSIIYAVKEWLTQKQQTPPKYIDQLYYTMTIDELLEELNQ